MSSVFHRATLAPTITFLTLTLLSSKLILAHLFTFEPALRSQCAPGSNNPSNVPYTGASALDAQLCFMVAFFHSALDHPLASEFLVYFIGTSSIYIIFPLLEGSRANKTAKRSVWRTMLAYPEAWLALSQVLSLGVTMCLYGLVFAFSSSSPSSGTPPSSTHPKTSQVSKAAKDSKKGDLQDTESTPPSPPASPSPSRIDVETTAIATLLGAALPSYALFAYRDPRVTVLWQAFPLYVYVTGFGYRSVRHAFSRPNVESSSSPSPPSTGSQSALGGVTNTPTPEDGYTPTRILLISSFVVSTSFHVAFISFVLNNPDFASTLRSVFSPPPTTSSDADALSLNVLVFLIWDFVFSFASSFVVLGFDAYLIVKSKATGMGCVVISCILIGPGATLALCVLWREAGLRKRAGSTR